MAVQADAEVGGRPYSSVSSALQVAHVFRDGHPQGPLLRLAPARPHTTPPPHLLRGAHPSPHWECPILSGQAGGVSGTPTLPALRALNASPFPPPRSFPAVQVQRGDRAAIPSHPLPEGLVPNAGTCPQQGSHHGPPDAGVGTSLRSEGTCEKEMRLSLGWRLWLLLGALGHLSTLMGFAATACPPKGQRFTFKRNLDAGSF